MEDRRRKLSSFPSLEQQTLMLIKKDTRFRFCLASSGARFGAKSCSRKTLSKMIVIFKTSLFCHQKAVFVLQFGTNFSCERRSCFMQPKHLRKARSAKKMK